eukprot:GHRR01027790.1.p1 GENE.GHRR01027790.1~~GHRR01027790.1.p1  ORF type:complete len:182 (-),score=30.98 GHRR01027790.1:1039-1584(-)
MSHTPENGLSDPAKESDDMGIFNRRKGSDRGSDADSSSAVNGTSASGGHLAVKGFGSHPVTDVKAVTGDHVSFSDGIQAVAGAPGGAYVEDGYRGKANQLPTAQTASQQVGKHADDQQQRSSQTSKGKVLSTLLKVSIAMCMYCLISKHQVFDTLWPDYWQPVLENSCQIAAAAASAVCSQ